jgi:hypothetical protein
MIAPPLEECLSFTEVGQVLMWREDLLFPIWPAESDDPTWEADMNLIKLKSQDVLLLSVDEHSTTQQWYGAGEFQQHGYDHEPLETTLDGDDDYVTVFGSGGYSVYNFQKAASEIPFPRHQRLEELDTNSE